MNTRGYITPIRKNYIKFGDKIFVRVMRCGQSICELTLDRVATFSEVIGEVRAALLKVRGLVCVVVRNFNEGWSEERMLKLYGEFPQPRKSVGGVNTNMGNPSRRMLMPWEGV